MERVRNCLPAGTVIDCYSIESLLGSGGFGMTYLARDMDTKSRVVIKEYLPKRLATRDRNGQIDVADPSKRDAFNDGRRLFFLEARVLATLRHPNIVRVRTFFLANQTGYLVMDFEEGTNLGTYIKQHRGRLSTQFLLTVFPPVLDALNLIHSKGQLHLDIKPGNIHIRPGGRPLLLDFGAVHPVATTRKHQASQVVTPGFSPVEQHYSSGYVGPWSDVYAMGATMRACIDGRPPPSAVKRHARDEMRPALTAFRRYYPEYLLRVIDWAMEVDPLLRPQNAGAMLQALNEGRERAAAAETGDDADEGNGR